MIETRVIVGLGNPGVKYEDTRHNLGFLVVQRLAQKYGLTFVKEAGIQSYGAFGKVDDIQIFLLMPLTYMNRSGAAVKSFVEKRKISLQDLLIVCDDFHLEFGRLRLRAKGSEGGHNGLGSLINQLQTNEFARLRVGIGSPSNRESSEKYVLKEFSKQEQKQLPDVIDQAALCCWTWMTAGMEQARSQFNGFR